MYNNFNCNGILVEMNIKQDLRYIYNKLSENFSNTRKKYWPEFDIIKQEFEVFFRENNSVRILELGCGDWRLYDFLIKNFPDKTVEYVWVDISENLIDIARTKNSDADFFVDDMSRFLETQDQQSYDFVVAIASFQHIPSESERLLILKYIYRVLNYDWKVIMTNWALSNWFLKRYRKAILKSFVFFILSFWHKKLNDVFIHRKTEKKVYYRYYHIFFLYELENLFKLSWLVLQKWEFVDRNWFLTKKRSNTRNSVFIWVKAV